MIDAILVWAYSAIVVFIFGAIMWAVFTFGPKIIDNIIGFIRWNRRK